MGERYVILDFDGVVSARSPERMAQEWGVVHSMMLRGYHVTVPPELVETIERWTDNGVHVLWLTTWGEHNAAFEVLGLRERDALGVAEYNASSPFDAIWWKWAALERFVGTIAEDARIVWCDDRMDAQSRTMAQITEFRLRPNVLSFCPSIDAGLTRRQVQRIEQFLS